MISVIIPAFNAEKTIEDCLKSLLDQSYNKDYEIIVVDDGSKDKTNETVNKFIKKTRRQSKIVLIKQKNQGPATARNHGARKAKGDLLLFTDADCIVDRNWIKEMIKPFQNENIAGVQGIYKTRQKKLMARFSQLEIEDRYDKMKKTRYVDFIGSYSAGYKKEIFLKFGGFDETFRRASGEDPELSFRISDAGFKLVLNPKAMVYHEHPDALKKYLKQKLGRAYWRTLLYKKHKKKTITESYTPQTLKIEIGLFYLTVLFLVLSLFSINFVYLSLFFFILLVLSTLGLSYKNFKKDKKVGLASPIILILRTIIFSIGLIYGTLRPPEIKK